MSTTPSANLPASATPLPVGTRLRDFEVREVVGIGGFGIVYKAFDHALEREVALKEYMPSALADRTATMHVSLRSSANADTFALGLRSFVNEARLLARFDHPSLVKVYQFWEQNGTAYMVMQLYRGRTLKELVQEGAGPKDEAAMRKILLPLLGALERLHDDGVFHRDISPDNIVIEPDGHPVLLDFGAARHVIADRSQNLTAILKPSYAPIEQYAEAGGVKQGPWTDFYALGATLHYLLTGRAPPPATARAIEDGMVPLVRQAPAGYSSDFLRIGDWMLAPRPNDRPRAVAQLRDALSGRTAAPKTEPARLAAQDSDETVVLRPRGELPDSTIVLPSTSRTAPPPPPAPAAPPRTTTVKQPQPRTLLHAPVPPAAKSGDAAKGTSKRSGITLALMIAGYSAVGGAGLWWYFQMRGTPAPTVSAASVPAPAAAPVPASAAVAPPTEAAVVAQAPPVVVDSPASAPVAAMPAAPILPPAAPAVAPPAADVPAIRPASAPARRAPPRPGTSTPPTVLDSGVPPPAPAPAPAPPPPVAPRQPPSAPAPAVRVAPPPSARSVPPKEACKGRYLVAYWNCIARECAKPELTNDSECVKWREIRERQRNSESQ